MYDSLHTALISKYIAYKNLYINSILFEIMLMFFLAFIMKDVSHKRWNLRLKIYL